MALDVLTFGEALVEVMRTAVDQPLHQPGPFTGPYPSGAPFIFAVQAARLGLKAAAVGAVGADAFGRCLLDQLVLDGVETRGVQVLSAYTTGVAFIAYQADGSRDFVFHARHAAAGQIAPEHLDPALFEGLRCLHIMGSSLALHDGALATGLRALELAQAAGAKISFDPNLRPQLLPVAQARRAFQPFLAAADVLLPTEAELLALYDETALEPILADLLAARPDRVIVVTQGDQGCTVYQQASQEIAMLPEVPDAVGAPLLAESVPGFAVTEVDPTGAGDCFDAGFLAAWLRGESPAAAARFANACGALAVTQQGPMAGAHRRHEVVAFIAQQTR